MARLDIEDDIDELIDQAVDTFFVEAPTLDEAPPVAEKPPPARPEPAEPKAPVAPSFDEALDSLFTSGFHEDLKTSSFVSSGDASTDKAIDLAVDTLFVEEPDTPAPETAQVQIKPEELLASVAEIEAVPEKKIDSRVPAKGAAQPVKAAPRAKPSPAAGISYDEAMAREIQRHMDTLFAESPSRQPAAAPQPPARPHIVPREAMPVSNQDRVALRKLQEAILTLEWEISRRSVTALAAELRRVRQRFQDNVAVDFAALSMRIVLDYIVKRMSRSHPESIRFLLDVTDYLSGGLATSLGDPLGAFHQILTRYESYKSVVRKAEGLPNPKPPSAKELMIKDPQAFSNVVEAQAMTLIRAGKSLASRLPESEDPENLIRSFRFLVNRSVNRILGDTHSEGAVEEKKHKGGRRA